MIVWANTNNDSWFNVNIWSTIDENNNIIPLGRLPQYTDDVYLNGNVVKVGQGLSTQYNDGGVLKYATLHNGLNPITQVTGGQIQISNNASLYINISAEYVMSSGIITRGTSNANLSVIIICNHLEIDSGCYLVGDSNSSYTRTASITLTGGDGLLLNYGTILNSSQQSLSINGGTLINYGNANATSATLNCDVICYNNMTYTTLSALSIETRNSKYITVNGTLTVTRYIKYESTANNVIGVKYNALSIPQPTIFVWQDITRPRQNSFIIVTNADIRNEVQYPPENRVVEGTRYAFDEKVGTFEVDYPPETVVLKDYVYDNGDKVGTLEIPQAPTTSDIVTAIKNDSDLGGKIDTTNTNVGNISTAVTTIDGKVDIIDTNVDTLLSRLTSVLTQRLGQSVTVEILQQILVAHLNN